MSADVHAWARERVAEALAEAIIGNADDLDAYRIEADAVLAALPELLTNPAVRLVALQAYLEIEPLVTSDQRMRTALAAAAEVLAGVS